MVWSGSRLACLPLAFICLPVLFICLPFLFICLPGCCLWSGSRLACLPLAFICLPLLFTCLPVLFICLPGWVRSGSWLACLPLPSICLPVLFICLPAWVLVVGFQAGLSPTFSRLSSKSFHFCLPGWVLVVGFPAGLSPTPFICLPVLFICLLSPRLVACDRVPGWLVSHFLSCVPTFSHLSSNSFHLSPRLGACGRVPGWLVCNLLSFVSQFFSFVSQAGACLPILSCVSHFFSFVSHFFFICPPGWVLVVGFLASLSPTCFHLSPTSFHLSPRLGACGRVGWVLVVGLAAGLFPAGLSPTYMCLPLPFICLPGCSLWSGSGLTCLPLAFMCLPILFICLAGWVLVVGLGACGRVPGWLGSHFFSFVSQFFSFVSQAGCLWSGCRLACLPLPFILLAVCRLCFDGVRVM